MSRNKVAFSFWLAVFAPTLAASAASKCPNPFVDVSLSEPARTGVLEKAHLSVGEVVAGTSTLKDAKDVFGQSTEFRLSSDEESPIGVCYQDKRKEFAVVFAAGMAGSWKTINSIYLGKADLLTANGATCSVSNRITDLSTKSGIRAGMTDTTLCHLLADTCPLVGNGTRQLVLESAPNDSGRVTISAVNSFVRNHEVCWIEIFQGESD